MRSDSDIERDVKDELQWDPDTDATDIAVSVKGGVVTLAGYVKSYSDKYEAEAAAKRIAGVRGVANDLEIRLPSVDERPDPDIARDAVAAIKAHLPISSENIKVVVQNGWVTLEGRVEWQYQRQTAENAVRRIKGVKGVTNLIQLKPRVQPEEVKKRLKRRSDAMPRSMPTASSSRPTAARSFSRGRYAPGSSAKKPSAWRGRRLALPVSMTASS
jgi:osmotically-inducible protein OsmY